MSVKKDCGNHGHSGCGHYGSHCCYKWHCCYKRHRRVFAALLCFIIVVLFIVLVIWLVLRPSKPKYYLQDVTVNQFNLTVNFLSTSVMATIYSRNPNDNVGIYYDRLDVYVHYKGQQVTAATALPSGYQGHKDSTVWSPYLYGTAVPLAPYLCAAVVQDETAGLVLFYIEIDGSLRWKVGTWISGHYHIHISCPAFFTFNSAQGLQFQTPSKCTVDV